MDLGLAGRACVVTGASRGIGLGDGEAALRRGRRRAARRPRRGAARERAAEAVRRRPGGRGGAERLRSTSPPTTPATACWPPASERFGGLDVLVNNAGAANWRHLDEVRDEDWRAQYELNVMAPLRAMRAAIPAMDERGWGRVVNVCSTAGKRPSAAMPEYSVAKAAELSLSRLFADRYAKSGVLVNAICPGPVESEMWMEPGGLLDQSREMSRRGEPRGGAGDGGRQAPDRPPRRGRRDRRRDRLPLLRARLLRQRRRLVGRRRHRPGDHLSRCNRVWRRPRSLACRARHAPCVLARLGFRRSRDDTDRGRRPPAPLRLAGGARPDLHRAARRPAPTRRRDLLPRRPPRRGRRRPRGDRAARGRGGDRPRPGRGRARRRLPPTATFVTGYRIHPFVGRIPHPRSSTSRPTRPRSRPCSPSRSSCCARAMRCAA